MIFLCTFIDTGTNQNLIVIIVSSVVGIVAIIITVAIVILIRMFLRFKRRGLPIPPVSLRKGDVSNTVNSVPGRHPRALNHNSLFFTTPGCSSCVLGAYHVPNYAQN
jgi:hypothetical protein